MSIGRNDLCPCGSGQKYKKCCLKKAQPTTDELFWQRMHKARNGLIGKILKHTVEMYGQASVEEAWDEFHLWQNKNRFDPESRDLQIFMPWFFYAWYPDDSEDRELKLKSSTPWGLTPGESFLEIEGRKLDELEYEYTEACNNGCFSFYEILEVWPGRGFRATDILTGEIHDVVEKLGSKDVKANEISFGMAVTVRDVTTMEAFAPFRIPPIHKPAIIELRRWMKEHDPNITADTLRDCAVEVLEVYHSIREQIFSPKMPVLHNTDGDLMVPHCLTYDIDSPSVTFDALAALSVGNPKEELIESATKDQSGLVTAIEFPWLRNGNAKHKGWKNTVLGHIRIDNGLMTVDVNSAKRAETFEVALSVLMPNGGWQLKSKVIDSLDRQLEKSKERSPSDDDGARERLMNHPDVQAAQAEMMRSHWEHWVEESLPVLGNITPIEAMKTPDGREALDAVLNQFERHAELRPMPGQTVETFHALRERLGL
jgi:hypothetical protein